MKQQAQADYRDRLNTISGTGKRKWVFAAKPEGFFTRLRNYFSVAYFLAFFSVPLIRINGMPFFLLNFPEGRFILFGKIFWPQDFFIFAVGMIMAIIFIALFTVIYGRLFCGWVCPQTIFMEMMFRKIEWWIEGSYTRQQKLDQSAWTTEKIIRKGSKHIVFLLLSFLIANTFLSYIISLDGVLQLFREPVSRHPALWAGLLFFSLLFYVVFAFVREIVCTTVCPYGRLQSVLFDKETMQISYDYQRGEPRGKKNSAAPTGDCIDCHRCVQVCPAGIDIRNGVQMECVGCTACIDACDAVMIKTGKPAGLVRYASEHQIRDGSRFRLNRRVKAYSALLGLLSLIMIALIASSHSIDTYISRAKGQLYQEQPGEKWSNLYQARIINKTNREAGIELRLEQIPGTIQMVSGHTGLLKKEAVNELMFFIIINKEKIKERSTKLTIGVYEGGRKIQTVHSTFLGPFM
ncbi:MAG TPA: cytochrome c oxidase accessory protein CcoG [Chitinophagaceae bacterium]|nr:cytochrome c oxidase accessory protein CcoG [Chitinophagaceae bacterium]